MLTGITNFYDHIHHTIIILIILCIGIQSGAIAAMFYSIQMIKLFLRTGFGESRTYIGDNAVHILYGVCQSNGVASVAWLIVSSFLVILYKRLDQETRMESPITRV